MSNRNLKNNINNFLNSDEELNGMQSEMDCTSNECVIKNDKSLVERINKKIITEDGRELLL
tara:strand:- start:601 stop:783 length:183 start_codon:yes stop_codon:yes gene_type:complete